MEEVTQTETSTVLVPQYPQEPVVCDHEGDPLDRLRAKARSAWRQGRTWAWRLADYLAEIRDTRQWREWGYRSMKEWVQEDLPGLDPTNLSHYCAIGRWHLSLPALEREEWEKVPTWNAIAALPLLQEPEERQKLLGEMQEGVTHAEIRKRVAEKKPELHQESEWRTIGLRVSEPVYELWIKATNMARYRACKADPTVDDIVSCMAQALLQEPVDVPEAFEARTWTPEQFDQFVQTILDGALRCAECGSWDRSQFDSHHVILRSHGGHEGPQRPLCRQCHNRVHAHEGGSPEEYAKKWESDHPVGEA